MLRMTRGIGFPTVEEVAERAQKHRTRYPKERHKRLPGHRGGSSRPQFQDNAEKQRIQTDLPFDPSTLGQEVG